MISVVIPAYNEEKAVYYCLEALTRQKSAPKFETILVDNNSTDRTVSIVKQFAKKLNLRIIKEVKKGRGSARHRGFKEAKGEIILSTDADTVVPDNWVSQLAQILESPKYVAVTGSCKFQDCSNYQILLLNIFIPLVMKLYKLIVGHYWLSGYNFGIKKYAYFKSGGFNPDLNTQEDVELGFKVHQVGEIGYISFPVVASGRRFKTGILKATWPYVKTFIAHFVLKKQDIFLDDVR